MGEGRLLQKKEAERYIASRQKQMRVEDACAVFLIEFDPGGETEQIRGTEKYHELMDCACTILSSLFRATDLVTCVEEETFLVFICGGITEEIVLKKADSICENLRFSMGGDAPWYLTVCTGAYMASGSDFTVEELLKEAREALEKAKQERIGSYCVRTSVQGKENRETLNTSRPATSDTLAALLNFSDLGICYLEVADQITATYISPGFCRMEGTEEGTKPLPCPFENLGIHPDAQEEYRRLLKEAAGGTVITHIHRISGDGKNWRWLRVQAVRTAFFDHDLPVILEISTDVTELIKAERKLRESNERLWVAFGQTPHILWEVDLETKEFVLYGVDDDTDTGIRMRNVLTVKFPEGLIENGMIHPDSAENFRKFAQGILRGKKADCGNFIMKNQKDTNYGWVSLSYRMVWNRSGMPAKAIGVRERLPSVAGAYSTIYDRRPLPEAVRHHMITRIRVNLTDDRVEELWTEGREWPEWTREYSYSEMIKNQQIQVFPFGTGDEIIQEFQPENLLESYEQGKRWWIRNYRGIDVGGNIRWMRAVVNLQKNIRYRNLQMFLCIVDTQEQHELESSYEGNIEYDETGQLYTVETFRSLTGKLMERHSDKICAMAMIHISGGVEQMAGPGSRPGQRVQDFLGAAYLLSLGTDCLVARYSGDRLLVFFPDTGTRFDIKHRLEDAFVYVRVSTGDVPGVENLRFIAAVTAELPEKADFGRMLTQVSNLCNIWRNSSMDTVVFPEEYRDPGWEAAGEEGMLLAQGEEGTLGGKTAEQNAALQCAAAMLEAQTLESSMRHALQVIGEYYQADRVYMMTLSEDHLEVAMIYEWMLRGKPSIRQSVLRMKVNRIPVLARCIQKKTAVFVEKPGGSDADQDQYWRFMVYPILDDGIISGFLCVENAHAYVRESGLLELMAPCLKREPERFGRREKRNRANGTAEDILNTLPNRKDFDNMIYALNLDKRSTMGALAVDVPELSALNSTKGFSYGKKLLSYITETLDNTFGISSVYRTWDNEFVVLFPDIIQDIFTARCIRVRALMQKRYPGKIRVGYTWAKGVFSAKGLVEEACSIMRCETVERSESSRTENAAGNLASGAGEWNPAERYVPYFQPKVDMRDGSLIGAEALVRGMDQDGKLIMPGRFIESLEQNGKIRELDFFMLESVLKQLAEWRRKGYPRITVSVNISRRTLFHPTVLASVLAIQSHYPEISPEQVELEITETAGNVESATMADVVNQFRKFDIGFELDDFGSRYANIAIFSNVKFNTIKLDRSLVDDLQDNDISRMLVENIAGICKNFGMLCVAEGVETRQQADILLRAGCVYGQGYYYSKPVSAPEFERKFLANQKMCGGDAPGREKN